MKHRRYISALICLLLMLLPCAAAAQVYFAEPPAEWAGRPLLEWTILDVNEGDAMILSCGGEHMMVDGGPSCYRDVLYRAIEQRGITHMRYLLNTHCHDDHIDGLYALMHEYGAEADEFLYSHTDREVRENELCSRAIRAAEKRGIPVRRVDEGESLTLGSARIEIFRCTENWDLNSRSLVLKVTFGESSVLLCADITGDTQLYLAGNYPEGTFDADLIKIPHHALSITRPAFLDCVTPEAAVVTNRREGVYSRAAYQFVSRELPVFYSGDGTVCAVTDGADWYIRQLPVEY